MPPVMVVEVDVATLAGSGTSPTWMAAGTNKFYCDEELLFDYRIIANFDLLDIRCVTFPRKYRLWTVFMMASMDAD